jgi:exosortase
VNSTAVAQPVRTIPLASLLLACALLAALYFPVLYEMVREWAEKEEMGHGFFVPAVAGWIIWNDRQRLLDIEVRPSKWGLVLVVWGFVQLIAATLGAEYFLARSAFLISLLGVVWTLLGGSMVRALLFPFFVLGFMVRWPSILYSQITLPLQFFASRVAEWGIAAVGIPVLRSGNVLELPSQSLNVVEACSGIRSLLSLTFLSLVYGYMFERNMTLRVLLFVSSIPIAVIANSGRVTLTGVLSEINPELAQGLFHSIEGWLVFMIALVSLFVAHWIMKQALALGRRRAGR